jgi:hypothetical protein
VRARGRAVEGLSAPRQHAADDLCGEGGPCPANTLLTGARRAVGEPASSPRLRRPACTTVAATGCLHERSREADGAALLPAAALRLTSAPTAASTTRVVTAVPAQSSSLCLLILRALAAVQRHADHERERAVSHQAIRLLVLRDVKNWHGVGLALRPLRARDVPPRAHRLGTDWQPRSSAQWIIWRALGRVRSGRPGRWAGGAPTSQLAVVEVNVTAASLGASEEQQPGPVFRRPGRWQGGGR